jgi:uncharacterized membrane protein
MVSGMITESQRERMARYQAQRERYLAARARESQDERITITSKAQLFGHPVHPLLIPLPLGVLASSVVFHVVHLITGNGRWAEVAWWMTAAGIVGALIAAVAGTVDWLAIPANTRAKAVGLWHGIGNLVVVGFFALSWQHQLTDVRHPGTLAIVLAFAGAAVAMITGWLGGELVDRLDVRADTSAPVDVPSPFSSYPEPVEDGGNELITPHAAHA